MQEECRGWDINEAAFSPGLWDMYQPMLRSDFRLFDEYTPSTGWSEGRSRAPLGATALRLFWGAQDRRVTEGMLKVGGPSVMLLFTVLPDSGTV